MCCGNNGSLLDKSHCRRTDRLHLHDSTSRWGYRLSACKATQSLSSSQCSAASFTNDLMQIVFAYCSKVSGRFAQKGTWCAQKSFWPVFSFFYINISCWCVDLHKNVCFRMLKSPNLNALWCITLSTWILNRPKAQEVWASFLIIITKTRRSRTSLFFAWGRAHGRMRGSVGNVLPCCVSSRC